jgi:hypothetical protein
VKLTIKQFIAVLVVLGFMLVFPKSPVHAEDFPFDSPRWVLEGDSRVEEYLGQKSLYLFGGTAYLKDVEFIDGIIEFDVAFSEKRGFFGAVFRMQDKGNFEEFYLRAHQSGNPDAIQYTPVYNGMSAWQLYHGPGFGAATTFRFDQWIHVKLVVAGNYAELYLDNGEKPVLVMDDLKRTDKSGKIGLKVNRFAPGHFANFKVTQYEKLILKNKKKVPRQTEPGTVMAWSISESFPETSLDKTLTLTDEHKNNRKWQTLECETSGLANISRLVKWDRQKNTVFARLVIDSNMKQLKVLRFGYSDRVKVYLNGGLLYTGQNNYRSRDYRYLGTIGYFDAVALALEKGSNELWLAVSENFGGWGIKCRFDDMKGMTIK